MKQGIFEIKENVEIAKNTMKYDAINVPTVESDNPNQDCKTPSNHGDAKRATIAATTHDNVATVSYTPPRIDAQIVDANITPIYT